MDTLYAPWRQSYTHDVRTNKKKDTCVFCTQIDESSDEKNCILYRGPRALILLNKYPYNAGHLLILPIEHKGELEELSTETRNEIMALINQSTSALKKAFPINGINVGLNLGKAAGGSIPEHLHFHVLPRFTGDTNFLPLLSNTKVVSYDLHEIYEKLKPYFTRKKD